MINGIYNRNIFFTFKLIMKNKSLGLTGINFACYLFNSHLSRLIFLYYKLIFLQMYLYDINITYNNT